MKGLEEFLSVFGNITISQAIVFIMAVVFILLSYKKFRDYLLKKHDLEIKKHEIEEQRDEKIKEALESVKKYPEYRQQSIQIQQSMEDEIQGLRDEIKTIKDAIKEHAALLAAMKDQNDRRDRNKLRDLLLQHYRHYTNKENNPSQTWSKMEAEAFWELFRDYEDAGGDGYMHTVVQPEMERLAIVDVKK